MTQGRAQPLRNLVLVLGDQLDEASAAFVDFDPRLDRVLMIEARGEATHVWSHKARIGLFLGAMRHFAALLRARGYDVDYVALSENPHASLLDTLDRRLVALGPRKLVVVEPGEWRLERGIESVAERRQVPLALREDSHFLLSRREFDDWASGRKTLLLETFYRFMRKRTGYLMAGGVPAGGAWNYDRENRAAFAKAGPRAVPPQPRFAPDAVTREALEAVQCVFPDHPGSLEHFAWPVTRAQALDALAAFVAERLPHFGRHQDAMWSGEPFLYHSLLSSALNLKLLDPREVIEAAIGAYRSRRAPLAAVEGFVRQILGWREFVRGAYWRDMPAMREANHFGHARALPKWYWTGETRMNCMREAIGQTLAHGYAHHIQRLMITGMFGLIAGLDPKQVADWYLAIYVDAVEWVELPNVAGMALYADGGRFTTKPYAASGAYVSRMSNYCVRCRYDPSRRSGAGACPVTTLYWYFLDCNERELAAQPRTALMVRNLARLSAAERGAIRRHARSLLADLEAL